MRSLEDLRAAFLADKEFPTPATSSDMSEAALHLLALRMGHPRPVYMRENTFLVGTTTLYKACDSNTAGIFYERVRCSPGPEVVAIVSPAALREHASHLRSVAKFAPVCTALRKFLASAFESKDAVTKQWERTVPQAELLSFALPQLMRTRQSPSFASIFAVGPGKAPAVLVKWEATDSLEGIVPTAAALKCEVVEDSSMWPADADGGVIVASRKILQSLVTNHSHASVCIAMPAVINYPGIEGIHNMYERVDASGAKQPLWMCTQMKLDGSVNKAAVEGWARDMHQEAVTLGLGANKYYAVLYCTQPLPAGTILPQGTIFVGPDALHALLEPFGATSVLLLAKRRGKQQK